MIKCGGWRIRLVAQDTSLSRRRPPVRIRYALPPVASPRANPRQGTRSESGVNTGPARLQGLSILGFDQAEQAKDIVLFPAILPDGCGNVGGTFVAQHTYDSVA